VNLYYQPLIPDGILYLNAEESKHCIRVLRQREGEAIKITDGKGFFYDAAITKADAHQCAFEIKKKLPENKKGFTIHIAISPVKNPERIEWFVEKSVEIGVDEITFIECKNTERSRIKTERVEKIAISAMKQSLKATLPQINSLQQFSDVIGNCKEVSRYIAYVDKTNPHLLKNLAKEKGDYIVLIGPEGDFTNEELQLAMKNGFQKISLGSSRLRTETAGLAACHTLNLMNQ